MSTALTPSNWVSILESPGAETIFTMAPGRYESPGHLVQCTAPLLDITAASGVVIDADIETFGTILHITGADWHWTNAPTNDYRLTRTGGLHWLTDCTGVSTVSGGFSQSRFGGDLKLESGATRDSVWDFTGASVPLQVIDHEAARTYIRGAPSSVNGLRRQVILKTPPMSQTCIHFGVGQAYLVNFSVIGPGKTLAGTCIRVVRTGKAHFFANPVQSGQEVGISGFNRAILSQSGGDVDINGGETAAPYIFRDCNEGVRADAGRVFVNPTLFQSPGTTTPLCQTSSQYPLIDAKGLPVVQV